MTDVIQVQTTTDCQDAALRIAEELVTARLAACAQVSGPITSVYRWQGKVESATEWMCAAKTTTHLYPQVAERIRELHSYEEPEIIAWEIAQGSPSYLQWLHDQLAAD